MNCPSCQKDSIPFLRLWLKSGFGTYHCPNCNAISRIKKSVPLLVFSGGLGVVSAGFGILFRSWGVFGVALAVAVVLDAVVDFRLRRLELAVTERESG